MLIAFLNPIHAFNLNLAIYEEYSGPRADTCPGDLIKDEALQDKVICDIYGNARDSGDIYLAILNRFYSLPLLFGHFAPRAITARLLYGAAWILHIPEHLPHFQISFLHSEH
ncbi:hypothetical protein HBZS_103850 [Helicobacter bizzozeronii CCUG 35545]|nr:hypothetical protein HBZS_103850 [Helicobacter bizzozeronii CCUG 35545]